jgi:EmrB/QacA subfamily drug resistance transporter
MMRHPSHRHRPAGPPPGRSRLGLLVLLCLAQLMVILDISAVNVALPDLARDLQIGPGGLSWTITSYSLVFGSLLLLGGRAADVAGRRNVFLAGLGVFTAASLGSALAAGAATLFAARAGQGIGAALLSPAALSIVTAEFQGADRARALGAWGAVGGAGAAIGVLAGGLLTQLIDWRAIFLVNLPVGVAVGAGVARLLPGGRPVTGARRLDVGGALLAAAGVGALVLALSRAGAWGWGSAATLGLAAAGLAVLAAFAVWERRVPSPLLKVDRLADRAIGGGVAMMLAAAAVLFGSFLLVSLYLQQVLGASALATGLGFLPLAVATAAGAHAATHVIARRGVRAPLAGGFAIAAAGLLLLSGAGAHGSYAGDLLPGLLIAGLGLGVALPAIAFSVLAGAPPDEAGMLAGLNTTGHEVGGSLGLALLTTVATAHAGGIGDAFLVAAAIAAAAAVAAVVVLPSAERFLPRLRDARPMAIH